MTTYGPYDPSDPTDPLPFDLTAALLALLEAVADLETAILADPGCAPAIAMLAGTDQMVAGTQAMLAAHLAATSPN